MALSRTGRSQSAARDLAAHNPPMDISPATLFASRVENEVEGGLLRYSARLQLLKQAMAMGIERFEANLIIASVQNRHRAQIDDREPLPWSVPMALMMAILVEAGAVLAVWHFLLS